MLEEFSTYCGKQLTHSASALHSLHPLVAALAPHRKQEPFTAMVQPARQSTHTTVEVRVWLLRTDLHFTQFIGHAEHERYLSPWEYVNAKPSSHASQLNVSFDSVPQTRQPAGQGWHTACESRAKRGAQSAQTEALTHMRQGGWHNSHSWYSLTVSEGERKKPLRH